MAFLLAAASLPASSLFALQRIEVEGLNTLTAQEVISASGLAPGARSIFLINVREVAARLGAHPRIAAAEVRARAPHAIHITVRERRAVAAAPFARGYALVDAGGIVIEVQAARPAQVLISERGRILSWATPGQRIDSTAAREGLALLPRLVEALRVEIVHLQISRDREVFIYLRDGLVIHGGPLRGAARRLEAAPEVLRRVRVEAAPLEYVDFSLADQVVIKPRYTSAPASP
jgi:cell division septal protein FtsQ